MFRPGLGHESPQGTARPLYSPGPPPSRPGMPNSNQFGAPFGSNQFGLGPAVGQRGPPPGHSQQQYSGPQYPGYPGPPPLTDHMPPSPQVLRHDGPPPPQDVEMAKNIDILSGFVVKNGPQFEDMARQKQANDPKFGFLFGGEPGSEAAIGKAYYEWKKRCLLGAKADPSSLINEAPRSPDGSDMDMEDDFEEPSQVIENKIEPVQEVKKNEPAPPSRVETNMRPQGAQNPRVPTPLSYQGSSAQGSQAPAQLPSQMAVSSRSQSDATFDEFPKRKDSRRRTGFDRPCMEDVTPKSSPPRQATAHVRQEKDSSQGQRSRGSSRVSRWGQPQDQPLEEDSSSRRATSSVHAPTKTSEQDPRKPDAERSESEDRLEAVTPQRDDDCENEREIAKSSPLKGSSVPSEDRKSTDHQQARPGRSDQPKGSPLRSETRKSRDSDNRRSRDSPSRLEDLRTRDASPKGSKQQQERRAVSEPDSGNKAPTVDEFGRFVRPGGSESDAEDLQHDRRRQSASRSRSRSPANSRRRRRSRSRSPRRHNKWSRSRSRSPRRRRSWSKSPPARDSRRGGDGGRGWDRGHQDRSDRGGKRGGRGGRDPPACLDFARGRCKRGSACRFLHPETTNGSTSEVGRHDRGGGGRGGRASRQDDRLEGHGGGGGSSRSSWGEGTPRERSGWGELRDEKEKDGNKEPPKPFEQLAREQPETSPVSDFGDDFGAKSSERREKETNDRFHQKSTMPGSLEPGHPALATPSLSSVQAPYAAGDPVGLGQLPPPPPPLPHSQAFPPSSLAPPPFNVSYLPSQSGFGMGLPPPPPPPPMNHLPMAHQPPPYASSGVQQQQQQQQQQPPGLPLPQVGGQSVAPIARSGYTWQSTPTATPVSMPYSVQPVQVSGAQASYPFPPPPPPSASYAGALPQYQTQVVQPSGQFNMMSDRSESGPPGAGDVAGLKATLNNASSHSVGHWKGSGGNGTSIHMDDVILESVSPGLPGHHHMENVSPGPASRLVMESVSPAQLGPSSVQLLQQQGTAPALPQPQPQPQQELESVSPAPEGPQSWSPGGRDESKDERADKRSKRDNKGLKDDHKIRGLTLLRTAVAEHVKETLKPTWREGQMSKEAFKTIAKKAVDKVLSAIKPHQVPNTDEKVETYMVNARPKIAKLVQGYVDKYVKA